MFCNKCGNELDFGAAFCNLCGTPVKKDDQTSDLSVEESIELADKLKTRYLQVEKLEREVTDNENRIERPMSINYRQYSFFRFYWKYLVFAVIAFYAVIICILFTGNNDTAATVVIFLAYAVPIGILIAGIFLAIKRRRVENEAISKGNDDVVQQRRNLEEKTAELRKTLNTRKRDLDQFNDIVPPEFRKSSSMAQAKSLLITKKASNLTEAFRMLK